MKDLSNRARVLSAAFLCFAGMGIGHAAGSDSSAESSGASNNATPGFSTIFTNAQIHGRVGIYDFRRWHNANLPYPRADGQQVNDHSHHDLATTAYGAQIGIDTGQWRGLSFGGQFVYTSSFYGSNFDSTPLNCNLVCGRSITDLTEGYAQYNATGFQIRAGRQLLNLPFASADQFSFLPRSFQGVTVLIDPLAVANRWIFKAPSGADAPHVRDVDAVNKSAIKQIASPNQRLPFELGSNPNRATDWQIFGGKITRIERRGSSRHFIRGNRYFDDVDGFWSVGTQVRLEAPEHEWVGQYDHYAFAGTENLDYGELGYIHRGFELVGEPLDPYVRAQAVDAYSISGGRVREGINSQIYGLKLGLKTPLVNLAAVGNFSPTHRGSFNDGQLLHPYNDQSGVLYTDGFTGIAESGPGWAGGVALSANPTDHLNVYGKYIAYQARRGHYYDYYFDGGRGDISNNSFVGKEVKDQRSTGWYAGFSWGLGGLVPVLAGLKIEDVLGVVEFHHAPTFYDNRFRFYYRF